MLYIRGTPIWSIQSIHTCINNEHKHVLYTLCLVQKT